MTPAIRGGADRILDGAAIALGFSIPISVALDNILLVVVLVCWVLGGRFRAKFAGIAANPLALACAALFAVLAAGTAWGERDPGEAAGFLGKYVDLAFVALLAWPLSDERVRRRALQAFVLATLLTVTASIGLALGLLPGVPVLAGYAHNPTPFKFQVTHNFIVALGAYVLWLGAARETRPRARALLYAGAAACAFNVLFMVQGRTGYLVLFCLLVLGLARRFGARGLGAGLAAVALVTVAGYHGSDSFRQRVDRSVAEYGHWSSARAANADNSIGLRLEYARNSAKLVREHPLAGHGTGSFPKVYSERAREPGMVETRNPHNEYLLIAVQTGAIGLAALAAVFACLWRAAAPEDMRRDLARGVAVAFATGCLFNSLLLDHTEGILFGWLCALVSAGPEREPRPARDAGIREVT